MLLEFKKLKFNRMKNIGKIIWGLFVPVGALLIGSLQLLNKVFTHQDYWLTYVGYIGLILVCSMFFFDHYLSSSANENAEALKHQRELELIQARKEADSYLLNQKFEQEKFMRDEYFNFNVNNEGKN